MGLPEIEFVTPHGRYRLFPDNPHQTLDNFCLTNKLPTESVTFYGVINEKSSIILGMYDSLSDCIGKYDSIVIIPNRNIDYSSLCFPEVFTRRTVDGVAEYTFPAESKYSLHHFELTRQDCLDYVQKEVTAFLTSEVKVDPIKKVVLGVSGGGDSNTLIESFLNSGVIENQQLIAVMMLGIPDWDLGKDRAKALCQDYKIDLRFVEADQVNSLLGRKGSSSWVEDFEKCFPNADLEILGTLAIRLALRHVALEANAQAIVTGLNLEDILGECILSTMQGKTPPPFPVRIIDNLPLWYPLYRIPKKILDGCHPRFSFDNYNERYPSRMIGRAIPYYLAQMISSNLPGAEFDLMDGFKKLVDPKKHFGVFDDILGFSTLEPLPEELKSQWLMFTQM